MIRDQLAEAVRPAKAGLHETLHEIHIGTTIALDHDRTIFCNRNVPADHDSALDRLVGPHR
jgi:hypothetical protein